MHRAHISCLSLLCLSVFTPEPTFAQTVDPRVIESLKSGLQALTEQRFEDAVVLYTESLAIQETGIAYYNRARAKRHLRQFRAALNDTKRASQVTTFPLDEEGKQRNAALANELREVLAAEAERKLGTEAFTEGRLQEAIEMYQASLNLKVQAITYENLGRTYCELEDLETAKQFALKAQAEESYPLLPDENEQIQIILDDCGKEKDARVVSWWTPVGGGVAALGGVSLGIAGLFANNASQTREVVTSDSTLRRAEYDEQLEVYTQNQQMGQIALYTGSGLLALGLGILIWDLLTVESPPQEGITFEFTGTGAGLKVSF